MCVWFEICGGDICWDFGSISSPRSLTVGKISKQDGKKPTRINTFLASEDCVQSLVKYYKSKYVCSFFNAQITA